MTIIRTFMLALLLLASAVVTFAQAEQATKSTAQPDPTVTVSISARGVRFAALGSIAQMRLEVFNTNGDSLYNSDFQAGNVRDWALEDKIGQPVPDGSYLCIITARDLSGRLIIKQGTVLVQGGQGALKLEERGQVGAVEPEKVLAPVSDGNATAVTLMAHDGTDGQIVRGKGALSFRMGDFFSGKDTEQMRLTAEGNVGIGITHPQVRLDVDGVIRASQGIVFPDGTIQTTAAIGGSPGQPPGGKTQGGKDPQSTKSEQKSKAHKGGEVRIQANSCTGPLCTVVGGDQNTASGYASTALGGIGNTASGNASTAVGGGSNTSSGAYATTVGGNFNEATSGFSFAGGRRAKINPAHSGAFLYADSNDLDFKSAGANEFAIRGTGGFRFVTGIDGSGNATSGLFAIGGSGNVGIGTTNPGTKLDVSGNITARTGLYTDSISGYSGGATVMGISNQGTLALGTSGAAPVTFATSGIEAMRILSGGNIGVGTTNPATRLDVNGNMTARTGLYTDTISGFGGGATVMKISNQGSIALSTSGAAPIVFATFGSEVMRILTGGNVGIGTTNPQAKLDVAGDIQVAGNAVISGNIAAKYQDIAEWVPARQKLAAGTVVSIDVTRTNAVAPSARPYDTHIAGVVSSQPGVILGESGDGKVMVATTGRVKVKVDATWHPIKIGDLLVTSHNSGVAMRSRPIRVAGTLIHRPGTIIGKALEPLANGKGEILVLLSLQ